VSYLQDKKISQSFLARMDVCPFSAKLYVDYREPRVQTHAMARGEAFHALAEWMVGECVRRGEEQVPPDVAREQIEQICDERMDLAIPHHERDALRAMAWNLALAFNVDLANPPKTEIDVEAKVKGWLIRGRIDWLTFVGEHDVYIQDWKTALAMRSQEDFERSFQVYLYALLLAEANPRLENFHLAETYPRFVSKRCTACGTYCDGHAGECKECSAAEFEPPQLARRRVTIGKRELHDFRRSLESLIDKLNGAIAEDRWPASPGSHCSTCPAQPDCPLPRPLRPLEVISKAQAIKAAQNLDRMEAEAKRIKSALREWVSENGELRYGDMEFAFTPVVTNSIDKDAMARALERGNIDPRQFQKSSTSSRFGKKKVAA